MDLDFRPDQWHDARAFGVSIRTILCSVEIVIGTQDEINAAVLEKLSQVQLTDQQMSDARVEGSVDHAISTLLDLGPRLVIEKLGKEGARNS